MSRLKEFHELEDALKLQMAQLEALKNEKEFIAELEFEKKLTALMKRYDKHTDDVIGILKWHSPAATTVHESKPQYDINPKTLTRKPAAKR